MYILEYVLDVIFSERLNYSELQQSCLLDSIA